MGLLDYAKSMIGMNENANRAALMDYMKTGGVNLDPATQAWCAAYVNATLNHAGLPGTGSNMAKSFTSYGTNAITNPQPGDIAVFNRGGPNSPYGHVGFIDKFDPATGTINLLAGNQGNAVSESPYNISNAIAIRHPGGDPANATSPSSVTPPLLDTNVQPGNAFSPVDMLSQRFKPMQDAMQSFQQGYSSDRFMSDMLAGQNPMRRMVFGALGNLYRSAFGGSTG